MSASERLVAGRTSFPTFELDYGFDDPDEPETVTVFAPYAADVTTVWISMDASFAVPLEDVA